MLEEFIKYKAENSLYEATDKVLLAVSGGIDSMVMVHLFISAGADIGIAHCNFKLRGDDSDKDEEFVKKFAGSKRIPFFSVSFDTTGFASEKGISIQMAARELRYRWFEEVRVENGYRYIALAHNLNDNTETFLINLSRGTGVAGLTGMKTRYRNLIRPLLFASRNAIENYCSQNRISFREDSSNSETKYTRNKIRHEILPVFREINPSFDSTISETAERLGEINEIISGYIDSIRKRVSLQRDNMVVIKLNELKQLSPKRTILFELLRPYGVTSGQVAELVSLTESKTGAQLLTDTSRLVKNRNEILVIPRIEESDLSYEIGSVEDFLKVPGCISAEVKEIESVFSIPSSAKIACIDARKAIFPMIVRKWSHGDFFYPLGMKSRKKLSDYFIDRKYSLPEKEKCLILESAGNIVWVIGDRIDNRFRITGSTRRALIISFTNK